MRKTVFLSVLLVALLGLMIIPENAFVNPSPTVDNNYELYGPHVAGLDDIIFVSSQAELTAMNVQNGAGTGSSFLDLEDVAPLSQVWANALSSWPNAFTVQSYALGKYTAVSNTPAVQPFAGYWQQIVNQPGVGFDNNYTMLSAVAPDSSNPSALYMACGSSSDITCLNVLYPKSSLDNAIIGLIYDSGARYDPTDTNWMPQLFENWSVGTYDSSLTYVNITLRPDVYWQDGVPLTAADVSYSLYELGRDLEKDGFTSPGWWTGNYIADIYMCDAYNLEVQLNGNFLTTALQYVLSPYIIPKHIWQPMISNYKPEYDGIKGKDPTVSFTDPFVIGSGPYRFRSYNPSVDIVLDANLPSSTETQVIAGVSTTITSPGYYQYYPLRVDISLGPANLARVATSTPAYGEVPYYTNITLYNLVTSGSLTVDKYVYIVNDTSMANAAADLAANPTSNTTNTLVITVPDIVLTPGGGSPFSINTYDLVPSDTEYVPFNATQPNAVVIKVACLITGDTGIATTAGPPYVESWVNATQLLWFTNPADIAGSNLYADLSNFPSPVPWTYTPTMTNEIQTPDLKVNGKDMTLAAKAFGTVPGSSRWNSICDVNHDYKIDGRDLTLIAKQFGWPH